MRVLFLNPIGNIGGAERVLLTAIAGLRRQMPAAEIGLICLSDGPLIGAARDLGATVQVFPLPSELGQIGDSQLRGGRVSLAVRSIARLPGIGIFLPRLRRAIARFKPDLVHSNGIKTHLFSRFAVPGHVPLVWHLHDFYGLRPAAGWLLRRARSRVHAAVAISNAVANDTRSVLPGVRIEVIPNAVDLDRFHPGPGDGPELDRLAGLPLAPSRTVRVGLVATYARWKGHLIVLDAAAQLLNRVPVRWYLVGGPIYHTSAQFTESELRGAIESRGLSGHVGLVPFADDPVPIYRALDIVLHASTQPEPFGLTVAESMACGRPTIVSAAGGAAELFTEGVDALGVPPGNPVQLAAAVRRLVEDSPLRQSLGTAARGSARARFDAKRYAPRLIELYQSLLNARS